MIDGSKEMERCDKFMSGQCHGQVNLTVTFQKQKFT